MKRVISLLLCLALVLGFLPGLSAPVRAATASQNNIVARADYLYNIKWTCKKTVYGWCRNYVFNAGSTYRIPYGQPVNSGSYIGFGVTVDKFLSATKSASSVFYSSRSTYSGTSSVYYAMDCSAFVSWCWGVSRKTTYSIPQISTNLGKATTANISKLQLGDALNSSSVGHVVLVTGLTYSGSSITKIEITEQTPPQLKRSYYTPSSLASKYGSSYYIQRYTGTVPAAPGGSSSSGSSGTTTNSKYYPACASSQTSIVSALNNIGVDSSKTYRTKIAAANGISDYTGTEAQNIALLDLMKAGKLINPDYRETVYYPATSAGSTLIEALESIGVDSSKDYRSKIAAANNISNYTGTYDQNITMLELLRAGKLINPEGSSSGSSSGSGSTQNGYDRGYKGGMAGDGKIYAHGLDVSAWQGESLNFNAIKNAGYSYVILRAGTSKGKDTCFETYYTNARAAGLHVGAYYYSYATTVADAQSDANNMLTWIKGKTFEYPIYFDYEDPSQDSLSSTTAKNICLTFCDAMADAGYLAGVYTGYSRSTNLPMSEICAKYEIWIARYYDYGYESLSPTYSSKYGMYQYTDRNYIGSLGPYDGDVAYKDYPSIVTQYGFNGYATVGDYLQRCTVTPTNCKVTTTTSTPLNSLPCSIASSYGSQTLVTAASGQSYTAKALYRNTVGNYWYEITLSNGQQAFLFSGHTKYANSVDTDLTLTDAFAPGVFPAGESFDPNGTVLSTLNTLETAQVRITTADGTVLASATGTAADNLYELSGLALDFASLKPGSYVYQVIGTYSGKYASEATVLSDYTGSKTLMSAVFTVVDSEPEIDIETSPYLDQCTIYPTNCIVTTTANTPLNTLPSSTEFNGSQTVMTAIAGQSYVATAVCCNTGGTYWYRIKLESGQTVYMSSHYGKYEGYVSNDLTITNAAGPEQLEPGESFEIQGTVRSEWNKLDEVQILVSDAQGNTVLSDTAGAMDNLCELSGMTLDFAALEPGSYKYRIVAIYSGSYASEPTELADYSAQAVLLETAFTLGESPDGTNPDHDPYLDKCTFYPTHCKVTTTQETPLNTLPSSTEFNGSQTVVTAQAGQSFVANALCCNTGSTYWYQITLDSGETVYLSSNHSTYGKFDSSDITLTQSTAPGILLQGESFKLEGTVRARLNKLENVQVVITTTDGTPVATASGAVLDNRCDLSGMTLDFAALNTGSYLYRVIAEYSGSYATAPKERTTYCEKIVLMESAFTVIVSDPEAEEDPYLDRCTVYPGYCWVTTTQTTPLNTLPSSTAYDGSQTVLTVTENQTYLASALYCNTGSTYWYQIVLDGGQIVYLSSNHSKFAGYADTDIAITNAAVPDLLYLGENFKLKGMVQSQMNTLETVRIEICDETGAAVKSVTGQAVENLCDLSGLTWDITSLEPGNYTFRVIAAYSGSYASAPKERVDYTQEKLLLESAFTVQTCSHSFAVHIVQPAACTEPGTLEEICGNCGATRRSTLEAVGHNFTTVIQEPTCVKAGAMIYQCTRCVHRIEEPVSATGHSYVNGSCSVCGTKDPDNTTHVTLPTLTLKSPTLEFKDTITINAFYTAENIQDVVEMGMITYSSQVSSVRIDTAEHIIPGATYVESSGRYYSSSQGIHAKYLGDTVYLAIYAKLTDGSYAYSKLAPYSAVQYATSQLKNSADPKLKKLVVAMLHYGAEAQLYFGHNTGALANASLNSDQMAFPEVYRPEMVQSVPAASVDKQGVFVNNQGFASRKPAISFEGAFCINYFFTPKYAPTSGITLYYWNAEDYNSADVLTAANATGKFKLEGSGTGEYRGDITGIAAKELSSAVYVAAAYRDASGTVWTSGVLGYSIGAYCSSQASKGGTIAGLAQATAVYGYHAKLYFG